MPKINIDALDWGGGTDYPGKLAEVVRGRERKRLGDAAGLSQYGVNLTRLAPGAASALRHWHEREDEFIYVLTGEITLIEDEGETLLRAGDAAGFKAGINNGHHLVNRSEAEALFLEVGTRAATERAHYPDNDLAYEKTSDGGRFSRRDGGPIET